MTTDEQPSSPGPGATDRVGPAWWPVEWYSAAVGWTARRRVPTALRAPLYEAFARAVGADLSEAEHAAADYPTFGDFFARRLKPGVRALRRGADDASLVSPCDGVLAVSGGIDDGLLIQAKGRQYRLAELLADGAAAEPLAGGWYCTIYLSPADYHRVHAPLDGEIVAYDYVPGTLWPVKPWFTQSVDRLFARNERAVIHLRTAAGPAAVVLVGAVGVGNLLLTHRPDAVADSRAWRRGRERRRLELPRPVPVSRGDELGGFLLGSTVVLALPPGAVRPSAALRDGAAVRCGEPLGIIPGAADARPGLDAARANAASSTPATHRTGSSGDPGGGR